MVDLDVIVMWRISTAALGRQVKLAAPRADVLADALLADAVVGRRVDEVDAGIEHGIKKLVGSFFADNAHGPSIRTAKPYAAVAELGHFKPRSAERSSDHLPVISLLGRVS